MKLRLFILCSFIALVSNGQIKKTGLPEISTFSKSVYQAGTQNWDITQDEWGFMYFANNEGVLVFNGLEWKLIPISLAKPVRSLMKARDNRIYVGLMNDFGYLSPGDSILWQFTSLRHLLPDSISEFDEIWKIHEIPEGIVFQSFDHIFIYNTDNISVLTPEVRYFFSFNINNTLYFQESEKGIYKYQNKTLTEVNSLKQIKNKQIWEILPNKSDQWLICTTGDGVFKLNGGELNEWDTEVNTLLKEFKIFCAEKIQDKYIAFGTILNGIIISDTEGHLIQHLNSDNGLQNNTILSMHTDKSGNLWLGLDNGIDCIEINSPLSYFTESSRLGTGYCAIMHEGQLYLGTNQGLFIKQQTKDTELHREFKMIKQTAGQVWSLQEFDGQLLCGHNSGTFLITGDQAEKISDINGAWKYIRPENHPDRLIGGHYQGLLVLKRENNTWKFEKRIKGFKESSRFLEFVNPDELWVSHGAKGIFKLKLSSDLDSVTNYTLYTQENNLPSYKQNIVFKTGKDIIISTINGIYIPDPGHTRFIPSQKHNKLFGITNRLKTFQTDNSGNIWYIAQNESGVLLLNPDSSYTKVNKPLSPLNEKYVNEFEFIYPYQSGSIITGIDNGFAHYTSSIPKSYSSDFRVFLDKVILPDLDSAINFHQLQSPENKFSFPFKKNSILFRFTTPYYSSSQQHQFSYYLEGFSDKWSDWSNIAFKEFTNLHEGDYCFLIKAKNIYEKESRITRFPFTITPPWYRTKTAYYSYLFFFLLILYLSIHLARKKVKSSKEKERIKHQTEIRKQEEEFQREALVSEKEIIRLRNEKLRADMIHRDKELANQTMNIIQKNKLLSKLKQELISIQNSIEDSQIKTRLVILNRRINKEIDNKQQNQVFKTYFEEVHEDFFKKLKEKHPSLSPRDLHLSAYIRMNLTTKEIATLQNITSRGVEISRYRLRKKLNLTRDTNLSTYLSNI